jgi:hypothetical protein
MLEVQIHLALPFEATSLARSIAFPVAHSIVQLHGHLYIVSENLFD